MVREHRLKNLPPPSLQDIQNFSFIKIDNVTALFERADRNKVGIPTAIYVEAGRILAIGTFLGNVAVFEVGVAGHRVLGSSQHQGYGQVSAVCISPGCRYLAVGQ